MKRAFEDTLSLLAGVGVGTALMYLLDPDNGPDRREKIGASARTHFNDASETISNFSQTLADHAKDAISDLHDTLSDQSQRASNGASDYAHRFASAVGRSSNYLPDLSQMQRQLHKNLSRRVSQAENRIRRATGKQHSASEYIAPAAGYTAGGAALLALGAGLAYLFDPKQGRARRTYLVDKTTSIANDVGGFMRRTGKHFSNRAYGTAMEATRPIRKFSREHFGHASSAETQSNPGSEAAPARNEPNAI